MKLKQKYNTNALKIVMEYRGYNQSTLCKEIEGVHQVNLSRFLRGYHGVIAEDKLKAIMKHLNWPFEFLFTDIDYVDFKYL